MLIETIITNNKKMNNLKINLNSNIILVKIKDNSRIHFNSLKGNKIYQIFKK